MTVIDILKALLLGFCVSVPFGPVAILVIQNSISKGRRSGFVTGLGATIVDSTWATVSVFAIGYAQAMLQDHGSLILSIGGGVLILLGISMIFANPFRRLDRKEQKLQDKVSPRDFLKSLAMGYSNPGAILIMFALFAAFGINVCADDGYKVIFVIAAVAAGSMTYWFTVSGVLSRVRRAFKPEVILWINRAAGVAVTGFGLYFLINSFLKLLH